MASYRKYPRTLHLPWTQTMAADDKMLASVEHLVGHRVIVSKKMDGENTTAHSDGHIHARSIDSRGGEDRAWVKRFLTENVCFNLPTGWRACGENLWARHSVAYDALPSYFLGFSAWDDGDVCQSWDDTVELFQTLGITPVEVIFDGIFDEAVIKGLVKTLDLSKDEGYVVRKAGAFHYDHFESCVAKFVRANHVQTEKHWRHQAIIPNGLKA